MASHTMLGLVEELIGTFAYLSKYGSVYEGQKALGDVDEIKRVFVDFQQHLYADKVAKCIWLHLINYSNLPIAHFIQ